jgi:hypothetical protein
MLLFCVEGLVRGTPFCNHRCKGGGNGGNVGALRATSVPLSKSAGGGEVTPSAKDEAD